MPNRRIPLRPELANPTRLWLQDQVEQGTERKSVLDHTFGTVADTQERIRHQLGVVPRGFRVIDQDKAGTVYRTPTMTPADRFFVYLKSSVASLTVSIEVF